MWSGGLCGSAIRGRKATLCARSDAESSLEEVDEAGPVTHPARLIGFERDGDGELYVHTLGETPIG